MALTVARLGLMLILCRSTLPLVAQTPQPPIHATTDDGRRVLLLPDGSWRLEPQAVKPQQTSAFRKSAKATSKITVPYGDAIFWLDPNKWTESRRENGRVRFEHRNGKIFGMIVSENIGGVPTGAMKQPALLNARELDPEAHAVSEQRRVVNGREVLYMEFDGTTAGVPIRFSGYYHGGVRSNLQVLAYTIRSEAEALRAEMEEFLNGIEIREASTPEEKHAPSQH